MKSDLLDQETVKAIVDALRTAAGEVEHSVELLEPKVAADDLANYKRMAGKVINAIYSGLADPVLEAFPEIKAALYGRNDL